MATLSKTQAPAQQKYKRFTASDRFEHLILLISFTMLGVTGLPQRYAADYQLAKDIIDILGGIESVRVVHRFFAIMLMIATIYHGGSLTYKFYVRRVRFSMLPTIKDATDAIGVLMYNLGLSKKHPKLPRFNFGEKAEYLAVVWGTLLMIFTGFLLWNPVAGAKIFGGVSIPAAKLAHSAEALLAILAIIIWHMYNVHIKRFNRAIFTGYLDREAMEEEHGAELEEIESGFVLPEPPAEVMARRKKIFWMYAPVMTVILVSGLIYFVSFEDTALETVPRQPVGQVNEIDMTDANPEVGALVWEEQQCSRCHGETGEGMAPIPPLRSQDVQQFAAGIRRGPADMPAFPPSKISDQNIADLYAWLASLE